MRIFSPSLLFGLFVIGGLLYKDTTPNDCHLIKNSDSAFVLTGDYRRIPFAMRRLHEHPDLKIYIIGSGAQGSYDMSDKVSVETKSKSTYQNAKAIKKIVEEKELNKIVLITTEDHINRARYLIRKEIPEIKIVSCPAPLSGMPVTKRLERWGIEYIKYIATLFGIKEG